MNKTFIKKSIGFLSLIFFVVFVFSCEEDFTDIRTNIVGNNDFTTNDTLFDVAVTTKEIVNVRADGLALGGILGQYLLGVYKNENYEKIEASIVTQLDIPFDLQFDNQEYGADTTVVTTIDTAFIKLPYQATFLGSSGAGPLFQLDSIIGDIQQPFTLNVYRLSSFLNNLDPNNPSQQNSFLSDHQYDVFPQKINAIEDIQLTPNSQDTAQFVLRRLPNNAIYDTDTISIQNSIPFLAIPIKGDVIQQEFIDRYTEPQFQSQEAFNNYFRGLLIEAQGDEGSLISFNFNTQTTDFIPSLEIYYTNTVYRANGTIIIDTIKRNDSFQFNEIRNNRYIMTPGNAIASNQAKVQGTAGSYINLDILGDDTNMNGIADQLEFLRSKNWLINDARLTLYVDEDIVGSDTLTTPFRLFIFKDGLDNMSNPNQSQILDMVTEGVGTVDGSLRLDDDNNPDRYIFNITDFISELVEGEIDYLPPLGVKVLNPTDLPTTQLDTVVRNYNWNPKAVMLLNHLQINGDRRPKLKISYSEKITDN